MQQCSSHALFPPCPFLYWRNEGNSQLSTQLCSFQSSPGTWEILLQPNSFTAAGFYPVVLEGLGAGLLLPNSTPHPAPLQWLQWKWKHLHWLWRDRGWDVCHGLGSSVTVLRAGRQTAQACTEMLCWCARAPVWLYSQGVNTELWRCSQAPRQAQTCPRLNMHLPTGWMWPLHCWNCRNTWQPLPTYSSVTREKGDSTWLWWHLQLLFCEVIKFSNIFMKWSGKRNMNIYIRIWILLSHTTVEAQTPCSFATEAHNQCLLPLPTLFVNTAKSSDLEGIGCWFSLPDSEPSCGLLCFIWHRFHRHLTAKDFQGSTQFLRNPDNWDYTMFNLEGRAESILYYVGHSCEFPSLV